MGTLLRSLRQLVSSPARSYPLCLLLGIAVVICFFVFKEVPDRQSEILATDFRYLAFKSDKIKSVVDNYVEMVTRAADGSVAPDQVQTLNENAQLDEDTPAHFVECPQSKATSPQTQDNFEEKASLQIRSRVPKAIARVRAASEPGRYYCLDFALAGYPVDNFIMEHIDRFDSIALALSTGEVLYQVAEGPFRLGNVGNLLEEAYRPKDKGIPIAPQLKTLESEGEQGKKTEQPQEIAESADWRQINYSTLLHANLETSPYDILVQPVPLPVQWRDARARETQVALLLIGVKSHDKLRSEAQRVEATGLAPWVVVLLLGILVLWPILKLWKMPPTDGFKLSELLFLASTIIGVMALITLGMLYLIKQLDYSNFEEPTQSIAGSLKERAREIQGNIETEIERALRVLDDATKSAELHADLEAAHKKAKESNSDHPFYPSGEILRRDDIRRHLFVDDDQKHEEKDKADYPWLDQIAWADAKGNQLVKWSVSKKPSGRTDPKNFPFFSRLQTGDVSELTNGNAKFLLTPITAPLTGKYLPILWKESVREDDIDQEHGIKFGAISSDLVSVANVVLPAHFGFAIIDENEKVQFHSDTSRGVGTKLLNGIGPPRSLLAAASNFFRVRSSFEDAIHNGNPGRSGEQGEDATHKGKPGRSGDEKRECCFSQQYLGSPVIMYPTPVKFNRMWTLVTWYDLEQRNLLLAKVFGWSMVSVLLYTGVAALVSFLFYRVTRRASPPGGTREIVFRYLPSHHNLANWMALIVCFLFLAIGYGAVIWLGSRGWLWVSLGVMPFALGGVAWWVMTLPTDWIEQRLKGVSWGRFVLSRMKRQSSIGVASVAMVVCGAVLLGAFPALSFAEIFWRGYRLNYLEETRHGEWRSLQERCHSVKDKLVALREDEDLRERRLNKVGWDRYVPEHENLANCDAELPPIEEGSPGPLFPGWSIPLVFLTGSILIGAATWAMLRWRFQWGHRGKLPFDAITDPGEGVKKLVVVPPWEDAVAKSTKSLSKELYTVSKISKAAPVYRKPVCEAKFLVLQGLEQSLENRDAAMGILPVLEELVSVEHPTLIVTSAVDPVAWLLELNLSKDELSRWLRVLNALKIESCYQAYGETLTLPQCQQLWSCCSKREKLVLSQLMQDGLPNRRNDDALDRLQQRDLVRRPDNRFQISDPTFANFVGDEQRVREVAVLFPPDANNAWRGLRQVLIYSFVLLVGIAVLSVVELLGSPTAGLFTLGTTAIPLLKLAYDLLPGSESKSPLG